MHEAQSSLNPKLSVIIITKNEAEMIEGCLQSVNFADEIIVVDSGSTDQTVEISKQYTPNVYETDWPGFGIQKNRALSYAKGEWILSLDADERVSSKLAREIVRAIQSNTYVAYDLKFSPYFMGRKIRFGDWRQKHHVRLFQKKCGKFDNAIVHENLEIQGPIGELKGEMLHFSYRSQADVDRKVKVYSRYGAEKLRKAGRLGGFYIALLKGAFAFLRGYFIKLGFLDGWAGFRIAWMNTRYTFFKYLWIKNKK